MLKRSFDIVLASMALVLLLPAMLCTGIAILATSGRPVLFRQTRPGISGIPFNLYKFRTMREACDLNGHPLPDSERMLPLGRHLRKLSLDELPQLWNVLRGDMSLVGPRPLLMEYLPLYSTEQARRHRVKPGITGWAQVNGRNAQTWEERFRLDVWYVDNQSFLLDLKILCLTVIKVAARSGVNNPDNATMPRFTGTSSRTPDDQA